MQQSTLIKFVVGTVKATQFLTNKWRNGYNIFTKVYIKSVIKGYINKNKNDPWRDWKGY